MQQNGETGRFSSAEIVTRASHGFYLPTMAWAPDFGYDESNKNRRRPNMSEQKIEILRAALRAAEGQLKEILLGLETKDLDDQAVSGQLREIERGLRRLARAA
jgi:hypothetical protein